MTEKNILQNWFVTGAKPTQEQFWAWQESYWHKSEGIPTEKILGLSEVLANKADVEMLQHKANLDSSNLTNEHVLAWKKALGVGELPTNLATIDEGSKIGSVYTKAKVDELLENSGKNIGNTDLVIPKGEERTLDTTGATLKFKGLPLAQGDASFNKRPKLKTDGTWGIVEENATIKEDFIKAISLMSESEKNTWKTAMNGGFTTNTMSVVLINPIVLKNKNEWQFVSVLGTNLNFNPSNFKIEICTADSTANSVNIVATIDNAKVQLVNAQNLGFWINTAELNLQNGDYKLRLSNGVASHITSITFKVIDPLQIKPLDITYSRGVIFQGEGHSTEQIINSAKDVILSPDANIKALAGSNGKDIVAQFQTDNVLKGNENWCFELIVNTHVMENGANVSSYFGLSSSTSSVILNTLDYELAIGKTTWNGSNYTKGFGKSIGELSPRILFIKYQNSLTIVAQNSAGNSSFIVSQNINTDANYKIVFSKNNSNTATAKTSFYITNEYKF